MRMVGVPYCSYSCESCSLGGVFASPNSQEASVTALHETLKSKVTDMGALVSGETILLAEFSSHSDLHLAERMALEQAGKTDYDVDTVILSRDDSSLPESRPIRAPCTMNPRGGRSGPETSLSQAAQSPPHRHPYSIKEWANVLLGTAPPLRPKASSRTRRSAKRLGVGFCA